MIRVRRIHRLLGVSVLAILCAGLASAQNPAAPGSRHEGTTDLKALQLAWRDALSRGVAVDVIVTFKADSGVAADRAEHTGASVASSDPEAVEKRALAYATIKRGVFAALGDGLEVLEDYIHLPISFVRLRSLAALERLQSLGDVEGLYENREQRLFTEPNLTMIGQPRVASAGHTGTGVTVAVLDGPVDFTNSAFGCTAPGTPATCGVVYAKSFGTGGNAVSREHATNVAGIVREVAPGSKVLSLDVFNGDRTPDSVWMQAVDWCIANKATYNISALNISFGSGDYQEPCAPSAYQSALYAVRLAGMIPVAAAGNDGSPDAVASPACAPSAVSVGAVYDESFASATFPDIPCTDAPTHPDQVPCFSQGAYFLSMLAPGVHITAAGTTDSGTSQAAPHVAGSIAILRAGKPTDSLSMTLGRLLIAGKPVTNDRSSVTSPRLQLDTAWFGPYPSCKTTGVSLPFHVSGDLRNDTCLSDSSAGHIYYANLYQFAGVAGQQVSIAMTSSTFDTSVGLLAPDGSNVAHADAVPGTTRASNVTFTLTATGTWSILASSHWPTSTGSYSIAAAVGALETVCTPSATTLCLANQRFAVTTTWQKPDGGSGTGTAIPLTDDTGAFWFFNRTNYEMMIKTLNACGLNSHFWVFAGGLTNVKVTMTVTDMSTGSVKTYVNPPNTAFQPIQDTQAFATCP